MKKFINTVLKPDDINRIISELEAGYDQVAEKFSQTRSHFWPDLAFISDYVQDGDKILDFGCGNGRLLEILRNKKIDYIGTDISQKLIDLAKLRYPEHNFIKISGQGILPFPDNYFNKIISIAVFHHFPEEYAKAIASELNRVMKPGGTIIITAWNLWQPRFRKYIFSPNILLKKIIKKDNNGFRDIYIPFSNGNGQTFSRYHRIYTRKQLKNILDKAGFKVTECYILGNKNIVLIGKNEE